MCVLMLVRRFKLVKFRCVVRFNDVLYVIVIYIYCIVMRLCCVIDVSCLSSLCLLVMILSGLFVVCCCVCVSD